MANKRMSQTKDGAFNPAAHSPFFILFGQDRVPSPEERRTIQELLVEKKSHLAHLNSQVPKRRRGKKLTVPRELRLELDYTRRFIKFHRTLISPWRRLPVEIMSEIFLFTLKSRNRENILDEDGIWIDDRAGTLLLCKVCSAWRAVAIGTPALWNTLSLTANYMWRRPIDWVSTWLDRSRSFPVHLQLFWDNQVLPNIVFSALSKFASHLDHTVELAIDGMGHYINDPYPRLAVRRPVKSPEAPLLSSLSVNLHPPPGSLWDWIYAVYQASPRLTHLTTSYFPLESFPVANLSVLDLVHPVPMSLVFQIFEHASNLTKICFDVDGPAVTSSARSLLGMKSITSMEITSHNHLGEFLAQTEFPSLVKLHILQIYPWPAAELQSFLSRSSCALTILGLLECGVSQEDIIACLQHKACNTLETLFYLTYDGPGDQLWNPNLSTIDLQYIHAADGLLSALVESRLSTTLSRLPSSQPTPVCLNLVFFCFMDHNSALIHVEDWKRLREMEEITDDLDIIWPGDKLCM
ncbi:hypothetical protein B0H14DRAFT_2661624 [Mycena olivaceomarginata]|nr:hypothetical protein B0H14DRAFT_2661624 [Mycena olivaceomarginata]